LSLLNQFLESPARREAALPPMQNLPAAGGNGEAMTAADWVPNVDIAEDEKEYLIKVEIPEVDKKTSK